MQKAFVLINCDLGYETEIINQLKTIQGIKEAHGTFGVYDILAEIESNPESLAQTVTNQIRKLAHIRSTTTLIETGEFVPEPQDDLIPDVIPEEKKPLEPPDEEYEEEEEDYDDDDDYEEKR